MPKGKYSDRVQRPTPLRNDPIISEAIFGYEAPLRPIDPRQNFDANFSQLPSLAEETYQAFRCDEKLIDRQLQKEEFTYYTVALLWMRLIDIKAKQQRVELTQSEKALRKVIFDTELNVPQPIYAYLSQIGNIIDDMGKETEINIPTLPTVIIQGLGGYLHAEVSEETHTDIEEIPTLGTAADVVMALTSANEEPAPVYRMQIPAGTEFTGNLPCRSYPIGPRRPEIKQRLAGQGISTTTFPEFQPGTRFNWKYITALSDIVGNFDSFRCEKVCFTKMNHFGGRTMAIKTQPVGAGDVDTKWTEKEVYPVCSAEENSGQIGASYIFGFQLYKTNGNTEVRATNISNWSCLRRRPNAQPPWEPSEVWTNNRNMRRNLPPGIGTDRFQGIGDRQDVQRERILRRMRKNQS